MLNYLFLVFFCGTVNRHCKVLCWVLFLLFLCLGHVLGRLTHSTLALIRVMIAASRFERILLALFATLKIYLLLHLVCQLLLNYRYHPWLGFGIRDVKLSTIFYCLSGKRLRAFTFSVGRDSVLRTFLWLDSLRSHSKNTGRWFLL